MLGTTELILLGGLALLVFGGKKVPEMMRGLGQGVKEFKKGMSEDPKDATPTDDISTTKDEGIIHSSPVEKDIVNDEKR